MCAWFCRIRFVSLWQYHRSYRSTWCVTQSVHFASRPGQDGRHFPDDNFKYNLFNEKSSVSFEVSLKFIPSGPIYNNQTLVQIMDWRRKGDKHYLNQWWPSSLTHIYVTLWRDDSINTSCMTVKMLIVNIVLLKGCLTGRYLVSLFGVMELCQHWLTAPSRHLMISTNADWLAIRHI